MLACFLALQLLSVGVAAQDDSLVSMEYDVKAAFLYKFAQYVSWPATAFEDPDSPIIFGVAASQDIVDLVRQATRGRTVQGRPVKVKPVTDGVPEKLHLLFVAEARQDQMPLMRSKVRDQPTLLVTESDAGLDAGGVINFRMEGDHVRFGINYTAAQQRNLQLSAQLLRVAREVRRDP